MTKKLTIGIIGLGRFGSLVASILKPHTEVLVYGRDKIKAMAQAQKIGVVSASLEQVAGSDIVILAVPISKTEEVICSVAPHMKSGALLVDTCSVKVFPCKWLEACGRDDIRIMGTHPMFGPVSSKYDIENQTWSLKDLQIVLCPLRLEGDKLQQVEKFLADLGLDVIITTPDNHDEQNAVTLSLVHFLGRSLFEAGIHEQRIFTPGFENLLKIYKHTTFDDMQLFFDMNNYNPYAEKVRKKFRNACDIIEKKIKENYDITFKKN